MRTRSRIHALREQIAKLRAIKTDLFDLEVGRRRNTHVSLQLIKKRETLEVELILR